MKHSYQQTLDALRLSPARQSEIRGLLTARLAANQKENRAAAPKRTRFPLPAVALIAALTLALAGFTFGGQIILLLGGGRIELGTAQNGAPSVTMDLGFATEPVEVQDGQIYFLLDGSKRNITEYCSAASYYQYEATDAGGVRHVVLIGGSADAVGWAEFVWEENGTFRGSNATYPGETEPKWLLSGTENLLNAPLK